MILPSKHTNISESLIGLGGFLIEKITESPRTIDELYELLSKINLYKLKSTNHGIDNLILALDFLFLIGAINVDFEGRVYNETN